MIYNAAGDGKIKVGTKETRRISHQNQLEVCGILKIQFEIRNQRLQKPPSTKLCENRSFQNIMFPILGPPF